jgi:hypothetical protein
LDHPRLSIYGTVDGFVHQGFVACPWCGEALGAKHFIELGKQTYGGCHRWLPMNHIFRSDGVKDHFNGQIENREMPGRVSVEEQVRCRVKSLCLRKTLGSWLHLA